MRPLIACTFRTAILSLAMLACSPVAQSQATSEGDFLPAPRVRQSAREILKDPVFQGFDHFDQNVKPGQARAGTTDSGTTDSGTAAGNAGSSGDRHSEPADEHAPADATSPGNLSDSSPGRSGDRDSSGGQRGSHGQSGTGSRQGESSRSGTARTGRSESGSADDSSGSRETADSGRGTSGRSGTSPDGSDSGATGPGSGSSAGGDSQRGDARQPGESSSPDTAEPSAGNPTGSDSPATDSANPPVRPERRPSSPTREATSTSARGMPSLRGSDGIERPVRFAPKQATAPERSWWEQDWDWGSSMGDLGAFGQFLGQLLQIIAYLAVAVVVALILVLVARAIADLIKSRQGKLAHQTVAGVPLADDHSPGEIASDIYVQQALELATQGRYREALGRLVLGAMSAIERARWIRYRRGLTLNDYLRSVRSRQESYAGFQAIVQVYEPVEFGRQTATSSGFESALNGYRQGFLRSGPTTGSEQPSQP